ncbi:MAG: type IV secretion protein IcmD [Gammaproteobacteria bacterium]|nr:type IV secretion protein IcmD [Gammaproteobacteria bacterium]
MKKTKRSKLLLAMTAVSGASLALIVSGDAMAGSETLGTMASTMTATFGSVGKLVTAASYIGGLVSSIAAILKFKQHKDNPQQTPIGQPIGLIFIGAALLFLPTVFSVVGNTLFKAGGTTAGASGTEITSSTGG